MRKRIKLVKNKGDALPWLYRIFYKPYLFLRNHHDLQYSKNYNWTWFQLWWYTKIKNTHDVIVMEDIKGILAIVLIKKMIYENNILIEVFHPFKKEFLESRELISKMNKKLLKYSALNFTKVSIVIKDYEIHINNYFTKWLRFEEDLGQQLRYLTKKGDNENIVLFKLLKYS